MFPLSKKMGVFSLLGMRVLSTFEANCLKSVLHIICVPLSYHISLSSVFRRLSDEVWFWLHNHTQLFAEIVIWLFPVVMVMLFPATMFKVFAELPSNWVTAVPFHWMVRDLFAVELVVPSQAGGLLLQSMVFELLL